VVPHHRMSVEEGAVLVGCPVLARNGRSQLSDPALPALLPGAIGYKCGNIVP
jgi:hypothetical protein